jgi:NlpC/P60 family putative phage cell wall peptidase
MSGTAGDAVVAAARGWIGTPYRHQASVKGAGCDCLGLLRGVWRELLGREPVAVPGYTPDWAEAGGDEILMRVAARWLEARVWPPEPGDVLLFRIREGGIAKHLGICGRAGPSASFIHAYSGHAVLETSLSAPWARRVVAVFAFPREVR